MSKHTQPLSNATIGYSFTLFKKQLFVPLPTTQSGSRVYLNEEGVDPRATSFQTLLQQLNVWKLLSYA